MIEDIYEHLKELCERRKSHRIFKNIPVSVDIIDKILYIAGTSPYASGKHNWEITVIKDKELLKKISEVVKDKVSTVSDFIDVDFNEGFKKYSSNFVFFQKAPVVFFLNYRIQHSVSLMIKNSTAEDKTNEISLNSDLISSLRSEIAEWERDSFVKSISCVAMLILLAAESLGLGACYVTGALIAEKEISQMIKMKKGRSIGAIIPIGYF
jgi:nitroreductase